MEYRKAANELTDGFLHCFKFKLFLTPSQDEVDELIGLDLVLMLGDLILVDCSLLFPMEEYFTKAIRTTLHLNHTVFGNSIWSV